MAGRVWPWTGAAPTCWMTSVLMSTDRSMKVSLGAMAAAATATAAAIAIASDTAGALQRGGRGEYFNGAAAVPRSFPKGLTGDSKRSLVERSRASRAEGKGQRQQQKQALAGISSGVQRQASLSLERAAAAARVQPTPRFHTSTRPRVWGKHTSVEPLLHFSLQHIPFPTHPLMPTTCAFRTRHHAPPMADLPAPLTSKNTHASAWCRIISTTR